MLWTLLLACSRPHPTLVLITLDTTRADALGVYGGPPTPRLDALADQGVRFEMALTHAPATASAHASLFTGLDPHGHRVARNGFPLDPGLETVAERLFQVGYETIAVVGSSALGWGSGMDQGFGTFDAEFAIDRGKRYEDSADSVVARALARVDARSPARPLFLWVHFFDAHAPYSAPAALAAPYVAPGYVPTLSMEGDGPSSPLVRGIAAGQAPKEDLDFYRGQYHGEVAFVDQQVGVLLDGLAARGLLDGARVVVAGDHGELLFEERLRPVGHGPDVDLVTSRVPLIVSGAGQAGVVQQAVALSDLAPTLLGLAGLEPKLGEGRDLGPALGGGELPERALFLEATRPVRDRGEGWNNAHTERGVAMNGELLIAAPWGGGDPRLYRLDPAQTPLEDEGAMAPMLLALTRWDAAAPPAQRRGEDPAMREGLRALGYEE